MLYKLFVNNKLLYSMEKKTFWKHDSFFFKISSNDSFIRRSHSVCQVTWIMAKPIVLFQYVKSIYQTMNIYPPQSNLKCSFNIKNLCILSSMVFVTIATIVYLLFNTLSVLEFGRSFNTIVAEFEMILCFFVQFFKMPKIRKLIEDFELFIKKSEWMHVENLLSRRTVTTVTTCYIDWNSKNACNPSDSPKKH